MRLLAALLAGGWDEDSESRSGSPPPRSPTNPMTPSSPPWLRMSANTSSGLAPSSLPGTFAFTARQSMAPGSTSSRAFSYEDPVVHTWTYKLDKAA